LAQKLVGEEVEGRITAIHHALAILRALAILVPDILVPTKNFLVGIENRIGKSRATGAASSKRSSLPVIGSKTEEMIATLAIQVIGILAIVPIGKSEKILVEAGLTLGAAASNPLGSRNRRSVSFGIRFL
jgi:hypothetical protein